MHLIPGLKIILIMAMIGMGFILVLPEQSEAHCDTLDGPVVITAKQALEKGEITPVLKWVKKSDEKEIRNLFKKTVAIRSKGPDVKEIADQYFLETLVRLHRAGEGAPFTGLKPAGEVEPAIAAADKALESGSEDALVKLVTADVAKGIRERFVRTNELKKHANESIEKGREFVAAYVDFTHYVERLHMDSKAKGAEHGNGDEHAGAHEEHHR